MEIATATNKARPWVDFSPLNIPGCSIWFDAKDSNTISIVNGRVERWRDKGPEQFTLRNLTESNRPTLDANVSGIVFQTGTSESLTVSETMRAFHVADDSGTGGNLAFNATIFGVVTLSSPGQSRIIFDVSGSPAGDNRFTYRWTISDSNTLLVRYSGNDHAKIREQTFSNDLFFQTPMLLVQNVRNVHIQNVFVNSKLLTGGATTGDNNTRLGPGSQQLFSIQNATFHEFVLYASNIPTGHQHLVESYLINKWNISGNNSGNIYLRYLPIMHSDTHRLPVDSAPIGWFDAQDITTMSLSGNELIQWKSKFYSPNSVCFAAACNSNFSYSASSAPIYVSNALNGYPAIRFSGVSKSALIMTTSTTFTTSNYTHFFVGQIPSTTFTNEIYTTLHPANFNRAIMRSGNENNRARIEARRRDGGGEGQIYASVSYDVPFLLTVEEGATRPLTARNVYVNGAQAGSDLHDTIGVPISSLAFGGPRGIPYQNTLQVNANYANISLGEWIIFYPSLTTKERQTIEGYLANKWNIQISSGNTLPSGSFTISGTSYAFPFSTLLRHAYFSPNNAVPRPTPRVPIVFTPDILQSACLWLDAADRSTLSLQGSNVVAWYDKSVSSNHFTSIQGVYLPQGNIASYMPSIQDASGQSSINTLFSNRDNASPTMFMVSRATSNGNGTFRTTRADEQGYYFTTNSSGQGYFSGVVGNSGITPTHFSNDVSGGPVLQSLYRVSSRRLAVHVNGSLLSTTPTDIPGFAFSSNILPLTFLRVSSGYDIGEVIVFNHLAQSPAQWQIIEGYLAWKWGIQNSLPKSHPFSSSRP